MADMNDLATFMDRLNSASENYIGRFASDVAAAAALAIVTNLSEVTPVDVGEAVSNWQVALDAPIEEPRTAFSPSPKGKRVKGRWTHSVPTEATRSANAPSVLDAAQDVLSHKQPGQPIFISNNAEYIQELDNGSSDQQPLGFVERAILIGQAVVTSANVNRQNYAFSGHELLL